MQSLSDDERRLVLGEVLPDQLQAILEYVKIIPEIIRRFDAMEARQGSMESMLNMHEYDIRELRAKRT